MKSMPSKGNIVKLISSRGRRVESLEEANHVSIDANIPTCGDILFVF